MGRPARFTHAQLQAAALRLLDREGLAGLSMRSLAVELGTGAMTLYNYVPQREAIDLLVIEAVLAEVAWDRGPYAAWADEVRAIATALWRAVRAHPHAIPLILTRRSRAPAAFEVAEALLAALARSGRSDTRLLVAFRAISALVTGMAQAELAGPLSLQAAESAEDTIARFRALPADRFPQLIGVASAAMRSTAEDEFQASLQLLLAGLEAG
ncbi:TetR/AcrR family transcriptional regulator C-terminal domain-containing protein [Variovorax sp.]|jgi:AcrR family transcriptional regulator|uniref:TetR/AcrR family transcriptional regulator n=1 Tax=Variovorax sp. TaxID=1871043 RepID=UPI000C56EADD|nr:TetR/AcrR family transcriptional regulator C-terminal domain-containing protein [Variovorax sp.]MBS77475.1 TetR family transcriptional regulator [Variovorax sp.]